jgi:hypothetical protein
MTLYVIGSFFPALAARDRVKFKCAFSFRIVRNKTLDTGLSILMCKTYCAAVACFFTEQRGYAKIHATCMKYAER